MVRSQDPGVSVRDDHDGVGLERELADFLEDGFGLRPAHAATVRWDRRLARQLPRVVDRGVERHNGGLDAVVQAPDVPKCAEEIGYLLGIDGVLFRWALNAAAQP